MIEITRENFQKEILQEREKRVLLFFYKEEDLPETEKILHELKEDFPLIKLCRIHGEKEKILAFNYQAMTTPHLILFDRGEVIASVDGVVNKERILELLSVERGL